ncbi:class I SAM-dependent methyltransferase [Streptomyces sp. NPDC056883]|uniref:class I SAM-dependent methyltransferase n=1 Tax=Streptomyces sp. NPDC056883 TaxID=3345959 RepID=UPI003688999A
MELVESQRVKSTSNWAAALRAAEHRFADRYVDDPLAALLCAGADLEEISSHAGAPHGSVAVRARLGDEVVQRAVAAGARQVVSLGAGSDTRPFRLSYPEDGRLRYYEVDLPGQIALRDELLGDIPARVARTPVEADLCEANWPAALRTAGWQEEQATVWLLEGLLYYLAPHDSDALVTEISRLSAPGSALTLDVPHVDFLYAGHSRAYRRFLAHRHSPYLTGIGDPAGWLGGLGWQTTAYLPETLGACDLLPPIPGRLQGYHDIWHVIATRGELVDRGATSPVPG